MEEDSAKSAGVDFRRGLLISIPCPGEVGNRQEDLPKAESRALRKTEFC